MQGLECSSPKKGINLSDIKKQASTFIQEKCKTAKLALTDSTQAEILTEEATSSDPWGPDAKTMTRISEAAYDMDDYWRIVDVIHRRLRYVNYQEWRRSYKTLVLLEFLLTHGPEHMFEEFHCDARVIGELGKMNYIDERGFNWGACMKQKSKKLLNLLSDEALLQEERTKALKISKEIQGFGNLIVSPSASTPSASTPSSSSSKNSRTSSFSSNSCESPSWTKQDQVPMTPIFIDKQKLKLHIWDSPIQEDGSLLDSKNEKAKENVNANTIKENSPRSWSSGIYTRIFGKSNQSTENKATVIRSLSDMGKDTKRKIGRQLSLGF